MFDRVVLINLDKRKDRLGAFKAKIAPYPCLHEYVRYRAVHGDTVTVPSTFISGGGAWGCRQSHLRVLEDALQDDINTLLVLEDDVRFVPNFEYKLQQFLKAVPDDWEGLMLGGQNHADPEPTGIPSIVRSVDTQRTHAYVVRGKKPLQELYRLWARCDRHIDHWFGQWQQRHQVYQPAEGFLCGQDEGQSDISGRRDNVRYWGSPGFDIKSAPITVLISDRAIAESLRNLGFHFGYDRDMITGRDNGLSLLEPLGFPADGMKRWGDLIVSEALERGDVPGMWHVPTPDARLLESRFDRPVKVVEARILDDAVIKIPALLPAWQARRIVWCWRGTGHDALEGLNYHGWHRGRWTDPVTGLDQGMRAVVEGNKYHTLKAIVRKLSTEAEDIRYGRVLLAHPHLDVGKVKEQLAGHNVQELTGTHLIELLEDAERIIAREIEPYKAAITE